MTKPMTPEKTARFLEWLKLEGFHFGLMPTPERMLKSPDSLRARHRAWLEAFIAEDSEET